MTYLHRSLFVIALLAAPNALAQSSAKESPAPSDKEQSTTAEAQVLTKLHQANEMEIKAGHFAQDNGESPKVKSFGARLIKDHQQADETVHKFAESHGIELTAPATPSQAEKQQAQDEANSMSKLANLKGADFDREFSSMMVSDHEKAVQMVQEARGQSKNAQFRAMLGKLLPVLQQHLTTAKALQKQTQH